MNFKVTDYDNENPTLHCPKCDCEYTHLQKVNEETFEDRPGVTLTFKCEEGHEFTYSLMNHKGYTQSFLIS
ncbi:MAG: hypothetical protein J5I50_10405 [Chitinophagaceae bacterium]|nr:hypothetical protein [Chitinophagaceae bacterium]